MSKYFSAASLAAMATAQRLARQFGAKTYLANVQEYPCPVVDSGAAVAGARMIDLEKERQSAHRLLLQLRKKHRLTGTCRPEFANAEFEMLCRIVAEIPADLIVTSTRGRTDWAKSNGETERDIKTILVPVDFSECSHREQEDNACCASCETNTKNAQRFANSAARF